MSQQSAPKVLVVSNPDDRRELCAALVAAGCGAPLMGDGGDDTFTSFERERPDVVVVCATLDQGDARALASAMRGSDHGAAVKIVLVGDEGGPVRNALDAADYSVDRFVGRPLSAKALAFAVRTLIQPAGGGKTPAPRPAAPAPAPGADGARLDRVMDAAIDDFVRDAMQSLALPARGDPAAAAPAVDAAAAAVAVDAAVAAPAVEAAVAAPAVDAAVAAVASSSDDPDEAPPPWREPTLILSGGGASAPSSVPAPAAADVAPEDEDDRYAGLRDYLAAPASAAPDDDLAGLDDLDELHGAGAAVRPLPEDDMALRPVAAGAVPSGGGFARELRRKMSMMAERLFAAQAGERAPAALDVGLAHDHHTEIDLTSLGVDTVPGIDQDAPLHEDMRDAQTFADVAATPPPEEPTRESPADITTTTATGARRRGGDLPARGELAAGETDVPTLMARLFSAGFTGRVVLRRSPAEKAIHLEEGRPVFATSNLPHDRMGDLLFREGKITRDQHARSRQLVVESGRRMGEILVEKGFLKRRELLPAVRRHIEDILYSLFAWHSGEFFVLAGESAPGERIRLSRHPAAIILEGVRRKYDLEVLERVVGPPATRLSIRDAELVKAVVGAADLSPAERTAIKSFQDERSIDEIAAATEVDLLAVYQLAYGLMVMGAVAAQRAGAADEDELAAVRAPSLVGETDLAIDRQRVLARYALVSEADYFTLLGVRRDATGFEIKRAYEAARRDYAGDSFPAEVRRELGAEIDEINALIEEAYRVLRDDALRRSYLSHLRE